MAAGFKKATVRSADVPATQTNFPVYVDLARLGITTLAEAESVRVYADSGKTTEWAREIVSATEMHVKVPSLTSTVEIFVEWDGVRADYAVDATYGAENVWSSDYKLVNHLSDATTSTTIDSTSNAHDMTKAGANTPIEATGKVGDAQTFDGSLDYIKTTDVIVASPAALTVSGWIKKTAGGHNYETALHHASTKTIGTSSYWFGVNSNDQITATIGANAGVGWSAGQTTTVATYGQWYLLHAVWDGSVVKVYIDGTYNKQYNLSTYNSLTTPTRIGASADGTNYEFAGSIDEVRIITGERSADWVAAEYNNQNAEATFWGTWANVSTPTTITNITSIGNITELINISSIIKT